MVQNTHGSGGRAWLLAIATLLAVSWLSPAARAAALELAPVGPASAAELVLASDATVAPIWVATNAAPAVRRAAADLADDFARVCGHKPAVSAGTAGENPPATCIIVGTLGEGGLVDRLVAAHQFDVTGIRGQWESYALQVVNDPWPGVARALVIAGSDRRGTIYGVYQLSEMIGVSPWYWWADVPVKPAAVIALRGDRLVQGPPAVKYRGIFLNDEDWGLRPWAAKTFDPATGNIGPKTYAKIFELLLRLHANCLWPAMHPGTKAFNAFPEDARLADDYGIVMGSSHCEQMLRNNIGEWDEKTFGEYNFVTNPDGVLKYWEQRVRENGQFDNLYTLGMRGIHDSGMPGGGTQREKAARLQTIIADQREILARLVNTNLAQVPQIFCAYKEVLPLYRLMTDLPPDITLVWPDDNYGYVRQFSNAKERRRAGGAGVYYHVSYWGAPRDYLWLCSTPPALIAEELTKAFDYGADRVWILNVGDLKPAELDLEFFLKLAWNPHAWNGTNTYDLLQRQLARDFGPAVAPELTSILAEYYRLNFQRKPEHMDFPSNHLFSPAEAVQRLAAWHRLVARMDAVETQVPAAAQDALFELAGYPVKAAAAMNEKCLAGSAAAEAEIGRLTERYNQQLAGGKWRNIMSANPRRQVDLGVPKIAATLALTNVPIADGATNYRIAVTAAHASAFIPGQDAHWQKITGLGYAGEAVTVFPTTVEVRSTPEKILAESPCLQFKLTLPVPGNWRVTVRALPTFSVATGHPQRYAVALDDAVPQIVALPLSQDEANKVWRENVLRNAALTTSQHLVATAGAHVLKIWMVDPGIVLDAIGLELGDRQTHGYLWPEETPPN